VPLEHGELLAEGQILLGYFSSLAGPGEEVNQGAKQREHKISVKANRQQRQLLSVGYSFDEAHASSEFPDEDWLQSLGGTHRLYLDEYRTVEEDHG